MAGLMVPQGFCSWRAWMSLRMRRLINWWRREFSVFVSREIIEWLTGKSGLAVVIAPTKAFVEIELIRWPRHILAVARVNAEAFSSVAIQKFIQEHNLDNVDIDVGIRLSEEQIFRREVALPTQAEQELDRVAINDLIAKTPFRLGDIYIGSTRSRADEQHTLIVTQWIVLRSIVTDAVSRLGLSSNSLRFVVASGCESSIAAVIPLCSTGQPTPRRFGTIILALTASALLLGGVATGIEYMRQQSLIDALDARISASRIAVARIEAIVDRIKQRRSIIARLHALKFEEAGVLDIWEEISTVLPTHSWLTELNISKSPNNEIRELSMHGFSTSASTLVGLVDQSSLFIDAALTSPVVVDHQTKKERFSLQANIRWPQNHSRVAQ